MDNGEEVTCKGHELCFLCETQQKAVRSTMCTSCRKSNHPKYLTENDRKAAKLARQRASRKSDVVGCMVRAAKVRAKQKGLRFCITKDDLVMPKLCPILGIEIKRAEGTGPSDHSPSLDRIEPELGYVPGNVAIISFRANQIKSNGTIEEHERVIEYMKAMERK